MYYFKWFLSFKIEKTFKLRRFLEYKTWHYLVKCPNITKKNKKKIWVKNINEHNESMSCCLTPYSCKVKNLAQECNFSFMSSESNENLCTSYSYEIIGVVC